MVDPQPLTEGLVVIRSLWIMPLVFAACLGCGHDGPKRLPVFPVKGTMTFDQKPTDGAMIVFHPQAGDALERKLRPSAVVQNDGTFSPTTYDHGDGLPAGEYLLTVFWPTPPGKNSDEINGGGGCRLPPKFDKPESSGLRIVVEKQPNELKPLILTR